MSRSSFRSSGRFAITAGLAGSLALVCLAAIAAVAVALPSGGWQRQGSGTTADLTGVSFGDAGHGSVVGGAGTIVNTSDGGLLWQPQTSGFGDGLYGVAFADADDGWAVGGGASGVILGTTNGGDTWSAQASVAGDCWINAITSVDATHAWAIGNGGSPSRVFVMATSNGSTWTEHDLAGVPGLVDVDFASTSDGWAVSYDGTIVATVDGGGSWHSQASGTQAELTSVCFTDSDHGWAAGFTGSGLWGCQAVLLATSDGGDHWAQRYVGAKQSLFDDVLFRDDLHGWALGTFAGVPNAVVATDDGGATWHLQAVAGVSLSALGSADADHAWAVGDVGEILATANGGEPSDVTPPVSIVSGAGSGWRRSWTLTLSARDEAGGSGVVMRQYSVGHEYQWQRGARIRLTSSGDHRFDGTHTVFCRAVDAAGNIEATRSVKIRVDTRCPVTRAARSVNVASGGVARVPYTVHDRAPCAGWARATLTLVAGRPNGDEKVVRTIRLGRVSTDRKHTAVFRCGLAPGLYLCDIGAVDAAGNQGGGNATWLWVH